MTMLPAVSQLITSPKQKSSQEFQGFVFSEITVSESRGDLYQQRIMGKALNNTHYTTWSDTLWKLAWFTISRKIPTSLNLHMVEESIPKQSIIQSSMFRMFIILSVPAFNICINLHGKNKN